MDITKEKEKLIKRISETNDEALIAEISHILNISDSFHHSIPLTESQSKELAHRHQKYDTGQMEFLTWDELIVWLGKNDVSK